MQILNKLTENEKKLLFVLFTLILLVISYQFGYQIFSKKGDQLKEENKQLKVELQDIRQKAEKKAVYANETKDKKERTDSILKKYPSVMTQEDAAMFIAALSDYADMKVNSITFREPAVFYTSDQASETEAEVSDLESEGNSAEVKEAADKNQKDSGTLENPEAADGDKEQIDSNNNLVGYKYGITITYQTTYNGLKKCIDYVNGNERKMNISDVSAAFDNTTGNLTGTMTINQYALYGSGNTTQTTPYDAETGINNIFGTFELPVK